ncbi:MAG: hypothetical protein Cons2KO_27100 [Congregibacter sp.]
MANDKSKTTSNPKSKATDKAADSVADKVTDKAGEIAKNIWLAGVGAYGKAVDEAQGRLEKAGVESPKLFKDLVKAGAALEDEARDAIEAGQAARHSVEERINRVRENFNLQRPARGEDLLALHEKIDRLSNRVDALTEALAASGAVKPKRKTTARKTATRKKKPAAKTTARKAATKKAPAKKTAARKTPTKRSR